MSKLLILNGKLLSLITAGIVFGSSSPAQANSTFEYPEYQYSCGKSELKSKINSSGCRDIFDRLEAKLHGKHHHFIFQSKINSFEYQKTVSTDTGIADYLVSTTLGVYFPTLETLKANSGGSFLGGIKLKENINLDAEIVGIFEGNSLEKNYFDLSTFLSLRFSLPLSSELNYPLLYFSPGIGISELDDRYTKQDDEDTRPTWQVEAGVAIPIHNSLGGYGGIKYVNQLSESGESFLGAECGITLKL